MLVRLHPTVAVSTLVKEVKGASSHLMTHQIAPGEYFKWQGGYGAFTLRCDQVPMVREYIANQKAHHRGQTLRAEWEKSETNDEAELFLEHLSDEEILSKADPAGSIHYSPESNPIRKAIGRRRPTLPCVAATLVARYRL